MFITEERVFDYLNGFASREVEAEIDAWLIKSSENRGEFEKIKALHELSVVEADSYQPDVNAAWNRVSDQLFEAKEVEMPVSQTGSGSFNYGILLKAAAVLVVACGLTFLFLRSNESEKYSTKSEEIKEFLLTDGSRVVLNENTIFRFEPNHKGDVRRVYLEGEAFFEVAKDKHRAFIIHSPSAAVKVLGTSFNLRTDSANASIDVLSGKVAFGTLSEQGSHVVLSRGERAAFTNGRAVKLPGSDPNVLAWKTGQLSFDGATIAQVAPTLEKFYKVDIAYDKNIAECRITSSFAGDALSEVLEVIESIAQISSTESNGVIYLKGPGCE